MGGRSYGYWFPLVLLGFGLLTLLGWDSVDTLGDVGWFAYAPGVHEGDYVTLPRVEMSSYSYAVTPVAGGFPPQDWAWTVLITASLVGTVTWYAVRARRAGRPVRGHFAVAVGGGAAVWICHAIAGTADALAGSAELVPSVGLPLVVLGVLAGAYSRFGSRRRTAAVVCLGAGFAVVLGAWSPSLLDPVLIASGLLALAWFERSRLVAVVAGLVLVALLVLPDGTLRTLVPAVVVLAAAIVALVRRGSGVAPV